jgi:hypothetical protein
MPDDLFGPHNAAWERFAAPAPKRKPSRFVPVKKTPGIVRAAIAKAEGRS